MKNTSISKNSFWSFAGRVTLLFSTFGINALLARLIKPNELGAYFIAISLVNFLCVFSQIGLYQSAVKLISKNRAVNDFNRAYSVTITIFKALVLSSVLFFVLYFLFLNKILFGTIFNNALLKSVGYLLGFLFLFQSILHGISELFKGYNLINFSILFRGLYTNIFLVVIFAIFVFFNVDTDLSLVLKLYVSVFFVSMIISLFTLYNNIKIYKNNNNKIKFSYIFNTAVFIYISNIFVFIISQVDIWFVGSLGNMDSVAIYGSALKFVQLIMFISVVTNTFAAPLFAELYFSNNHNKLSILIKCISAVNFFPALILFIMYTIFGQNILSAVYGDYYAKAYLVLVILSFGQLVSLFTGPGGILLNMVGKEKILMKINLLTLIVIVSGGYLSFINYSINGLAVFISFITIINSFTIAYISKKTLNVWTFAYLNPFMIFKIKEL